MLALIIALFVFLALWAAMEAEQKRKRIEQAYKANPVVKILDGPQSAKFVSSKKDLKKAGLL